MNARFRYTLEPLLLSRQWHMDALLIELAGQNDALARQEKTIRESKALMCSASDDWQALVDQAQALPVAQFVMYTRYMGDLGGQVREQEAVMACLVEAHDELIGRIVASQRGLEAVEEHRDDMKAKFVRQRLSGDFKIADDNWSTLHAGMAGNDR